MKKNGFTLVELLAVIVILTIVITIGFTSVIRVRENSLREIVDNKIEQIEQAAILYGQENSEELTNTDCPEITTTVNRNGQDVTTTFTPELCVIKTAGDLIDSGFFDSGYLTEDGLDLINDVTDKSMREDTVIIYRRNNRIYSIIDDIKSNEE